MTRVVKYGRTKNFAATSALRKYRDMNGLTNTQIAEKTGDTADNIQQWIRREKVPKAVLEKLGIAYRSKRLDKASPPPATKTGGLICVCYVDADKKQAFESFCTALNINVKDLI